MNEIIPFPTHVERLDNGLGVIVMQMPGNGLLAYWSIVRTGSRDEYEPGRTGFAHFFEHMMFRGTERYPSDEYQRIVTEIGADTNAYTTDDYTAYHFSMAAEDLERVMELESDRFQRLLYSEQAFETEAGAVYGEYRMSRTNPLFVAYEAIREVAFDTHTYGHTTMGHERDIAAMPEMYEYSLSFFSRYYRPDNTVLFIAGDVAPKRVVALAKRYYGAWRPGYARPPVPEEPEQRAERRIDVAYDGRTLPIVWLAYKVDALDPAHSTRVAAELLAELAFGPSSELYRRLVLEEHVVESLIASAGLNRDPGVLDVYARVKDPGRVEYVLGLIDAAAASHCESPAAAERLEAAKAHIRYQFLMGFETPATAAENLARHIGVRGNLQAVPALYEAYAAVRAEDVRRAAGAYLRPERRTVAVLRGRGS